MKDYKNLVFSVKRQHEICDAIKLKRLETVLPEAMKASGIDMWLVLAGEQNEDPVFFSMVPTIKDHASRMTCLAFCLEADGTVSRYSINKPNAALARFYRQLEFDNDRQWEQIAEFVREKDPKRIGINDSSVSSLTAGLAAGLRDELIKHLGDLAARLVPADDLCVRWIETRIEEEMVMYPALYELTTSVMARAFSREVIVPGITTTEDVEWWAVEEFDQLGVPLSFRTDVNLQRQGEDGKFVTGVIRPGDILHYDAGIQYLGLATDHQRQAYVLKPGETKAPEGLIAGCRTGRRFAELAASEMQFGRTGNQVFHAAIASAKNEGIDARLYSHPIGLFVHSAGPTIGLYDKQQSVPGRGENILRPNTAYALEFNVGGAVPEWGGQYLRFYLEETVLLRESGRLTFLDDDAWKLMLI
ncbi:MAG: aminopeptidase P family protein [Firmicutes bacterium]|nr:aminopeptidase P family protein [Bacillota bacterium]